MNRTMKWLAVAAAVTLGVGLSVGTGVMTASAHDHTDGVTCQAATVDLTSYPSGSTVAVTLDGVDQHPAFTEGGNYSFTHALTFDATHTSHTLVVAVTSPDGTADNGYTFTHTDVTPANCYTAPTTPPAPAAQPCKVTGTAYTEDGLPATLADGEQSYVGGSGHALNWLIPVSGNLQGFTTAGYTITSQSGYHVGYRFVLHSNGTTGYTSVTAEPYMNGWVAGQTGTFTITPATLVWNSHIANGNPGAQDHPVSITAMAALIPNNQLISVGLHLGSTEKADTHSTVSKITGCVMFTAAPTGGSTPPPVTVTPQAPTAVHTGDVSPMAPWFPVMAFLLLGSILAVAAVRQRTE